MLWKVYFTFSPSTQKRIHGEKHILGARLRRNQGFIWSSGALCGSSERDHRALSPAAINIQLKLQTTSFTTRQKIYVPVNTSHRFYCSLFVPVYCPTAQTGHLERYWVTISFWGNTEKTSPSVLPDMQIGMLWQLTASLLPDRWHHVASSQPNLA